VHDQTEKQWLEGRFSEVGTCICLKKSGEKRVIPKVTYQECLKVSEEWTAFKWVPEDVATYEELKAGCSLGETAE
jgi:hypothetical protein